MSGPGFTSPFGANSNPFGSSRLDTGAMQRVAEEDENDTVTSPTTPSFVQTAGYMFRGPFGGDSASEPQHSGLRSPPVSEGYPAQYNFGRRTSVSAESLKPVGDSYDNWAPPVHPKTSEQLGRLKQAMSGNFLFSHLNDVAKRFRFMRAFGRKKPILTQGNSRALSTSMSIAGAATVISAEPQCMLWALDRVTFRRILMESTFARRRMYEGFLEEVPLLSTLTPYERSKIADALESQKFPAGHTIIREGDPGHSFYLLEAGEAVAYRSGNDTPVKHYKKGDFFGELALLNDAPRAASVVSQTEVKVARLGKSAFQRLLGPVEGIMRRTKYVGVKTGVEEMDPLQMS
ncbi:hypothetical protein CHGG_00688 [Chaetomium globosum CBS 148.51]|uniref:cAMP-dependent protein kinase regulatory subunit n=1 Tax=Chaetomium globosum (strain ATCC 6205 / CBS 148.51 / DSM 1962 / NBRC 6347 / NRRL 1970) TaxID=306901 RepID=Q2HGG6_CHAGB|nr:uncharacterized protein CHGG_00688 [Chaetomium globosum CBS 148.51]EAQ92453.1 hypothetical protein CHGG_00688 [Chaetomium globosum CBS 148.51]